MKNIIYLFCIFVIVFSFNTKSVLDDPVLPGADGGSLGLAKPLCVTL